ncbi:MAG TPA: PAS domain S-box protein, partial [Thermoanaerobaculia bacterium]
MNSATASGTTRRAPRRSAWRITLAYIGIGAAWIVLTDIASLGFGSRAGGPIVTVSMVKGIFWIVASGLLLHILVFERVERARAFEIAVRRRLLEGEEIGRFGVAESFADDRRARWSEGMFRLWGRSIAEGEPDAEWLARHVAPDDLPRALAAADAAARGEAVPPYEIRIHSDDGSGRYLRITTRTETADGRTRTLVLAQDVTEVRALERNAAESLGLLRSVLESTAEGIIVVRIDTRELLLWNERFLELSHVPREVVERLDSRASVTEFVARARNEEQVRAWIDEIYRNPEAECVDLIEMKDGTILERHTAPVLIEGQPRARIWSFRDVTDRIRATEALRRRERALAESQKIGHLGSFEW